MPSDTHFPSNSNFYTAVQEASVWHAYLYYNPGLLHIIPCPRDFYVQNISVHVFVYYTDFDLYIA